MTTLSPLSTKKLKIIQTIHHEYGNQTNKKNFQKKSHIVIYTIH